jgi:hypothetical protein
MMTVIVVLTATTMGTEDAEAGETATVEDAEEEAAAGVACTVAKFAASASRKLISLTSKM